MRWMLAALLWATALGGACPALANDSTVPLEVAYFYSPNCLNCREVSKRLDDIEASYGDRVSVIRHDILTNEGLMRMIAYEDQQEVTAENPPVIFVGDQYLAELEPILERLSTVLDEELAYHETRGGGALTSAPASEDDQARVLHRFASYRATTVAVAGLIDGVNPCAFTTIVFLLSMLAFLGKGRRELAIVGASFTAAIFGTYLLLGVGLLAAIKTFAVSRGISLVLTYVVAALTFTLAGWCFVDAIRFWRTGKVPKGALGMPNAIKQRVHKVIRTGLKTPSLVVGSFVVGALVAILESICTGQVYLPTILFVFRTTDRRLQALGYLALYNLMFILPLVVLVGLSYWGVGSQRLGDVMRKHLGAAKVLLGVLFVGLGVLLLATI